MEKERRNVRRRNAAGAAVEEADRTHLPSHRRGMVNWRGVVGVAQLRKLTGPTFRRTAAAW